MKIRQKLTLQFFLMSGIIMVLFSLTVYVSSARYRRDDFFQRLESRANSTASIIFPRFLESHTATARSFGIRACAVRTALYGWFWDWGRAPLIG